MGKALRPPAPARRGSTRCARERRATISRRCTSSPSLALGAVESAVVADLRRATGRFPHSTRLRGLIRELTTGSARFGELWAAGAVGAHQEDRKIVAHHGGRADHGDCDVITEGAADQKIVTLTAAPGTEDETRLRLAVVSGVPDRTRV